MPSTVVSSRALIHRLRPNTSGTTATLVRVKVADGLAGDEDHQHQQPVAADHGEHPGGHPHHDEAAGHVGRASAHPAPGPVAEPAGHRVGQPADQPVGGQGEGHGQGARGPLLDEQGDEDPGDGQVGPGPDQADGQSDEAADPGAVDAAQRPRRGGARLPPARPWPSAPLAPSGRSPEAAGRPPGRVGQVRPRRSAVVPPLTRRCRSRSRRPPGPAGASPVDSR